MAQPMELLINECLKIERQQAFGVGALADLIGLA
jgi:hypothetical protein